MAELPKFEVTENCLYRPVDKHGLVIEADVVLTREEFVACYNKWIKGPYDEAYDQMKRSVLDKYGIQDESLGDEPLGDEPLGGEYDNKPLPVSSYEELCKSVPSSGVEAYEKAIKDAIESRAKIERQMKQEKNKETDITRLACFDCKFAAACEDSDYVICTKRNTKVAVNDTPCLQHYKPRYTN